MTNQKEFDEYSNYDDRPKVRKIESKTTDYSVENVRSNYEEIAQEKTSLASNSNHSSLKKN